MRIAGVCFGVVGIIALLSIPKISSAEYILAVAGLTMVFCGLWLFSRGEDPDLQKERRKKMAKIDRLLILTALVAGLWVAILSVACSSSVFLLGMFSILALLIRVAWLAWKDTFTTE